MQVSVSVHPKFTNDDVGVKISQQQRKLKEDDAGAPDQIAAAEPGQTDLGNDQLDLEE